MAFWNGQTLAERLDKENLVSPFRRANIDCAAYTLSMGEEYYVTPARIEAESKKGTISHLEKDESFKIAPGQFAFLLTEEIVRVPRDALAFISIRTSYKWKGLANISGFHVDPGWNGKLVFGVYNAGASEIHIKRGAPLFLLWYADLNPYEGDGSGFFKEYSENNEPRGGIDSAWVDGLSSHIYSPMTLLEDTRELKEMLNSEVRFRTVRTWVFSTLLAALALTFAVVGLSGRMVYQATSTRIHSIERQLDRLERTMSTEYGRPAGRPNPPSTTPEKEPSSSKP